MANIATATTTMALQAATAATFDVDTDVTEIAAAEDDLAVFLVDFDFFDVGVFGGVVSDDVGDDVGDVVGDVVGDNVGDDVGDVVGDNVAEHCLKNM